MDDDCHIVDASPLLAFLQYDKEPNTVAWRFPTIRDYDEDRMGIPIELGRCRLSNLVGNGVLMDVRRILSIGGFRDLLMYRGEEGELSIRIFGAGWDITYVPEIEFIHRHIPNDTRGKAFNREYEVLTARNIVLVKGLNFPFPFGFFDGLLRAVKATVTAPSGAKRFRMAGMREGIVTLFLHWRDRTPLTWRQMREFKRLQRDVQAAVAKHGSRP